MVSGTPAQVWHGNADHTPGGITKDGLMMVDGHIKYKGKVLAARARTKREGKKSFAKVWGGKKGAPFTLAPEVGTPEYEKKRNKQKTKEKKIKK